MTTTLYKSVDVLRFRLACLTVKKATEAGYPIVVVDKSPIPEIANTLRNLGAIVFPSITTTGMGADRRLFFFLANEIAVAAGCKIFLWLEPEKHDLIRFIPSIIQPIKNAWVGVDIVIPRRSTASWATYPDFQMASELIINEAFQKVTGIPDADMTNGPVAFHMNALKYFQAADGRKFGVEDNYVQHYGPLIALRNGMGVISVNTDFVYPPEQKAEEEGPLRDEIIKKRQWQFEQLTTAYEKVFAGAGKLKV